MPAHGGPDALGVPLHDFSTNANACGPCPEALAAVRGADASRYPDPQYGALRARLAALHGVDPARIVVAASASEFIVRITAAVARQARGTVQVPAHAYGDYAQAARAQGLVVAVEAAQPPCLGWACEPSTPLGQDEAGLAARIDAWPAERPLVLDRAYAPLRLTGAGTLSPARLDRLWQLFSPNKALGLTGVRGAYAIAPVLASPLQARVEALAPSWPLGAHAVAMLDAWAGDAAQRWLADCRPVLAAWKARQQALCASWGWDVLPSQANFFCARWPDAVPMPSALGALRAQGIKLRDCTCFGLPGHVRLGVLPPASQEALAAAWHGVRMM